MNCKWVLTFLLLILVMVAPANAAAPVAAFTYTTDKGISPHSVTFTNTSTNSPTTLDWNFGDGSAHGSTNTVTHLYTKRGLFNVSLNASNSAGYNIAYKNIKVIGNSPQELIVEGDILYDTELQTALLLLALVIGGILGWKRYKKW